MEAYIGGVSTRRVDALVAALGSQSGISKSQVSRICQDIDQQVQAFLARPLESTGYAYVRPQPPLRPQPGIRHAPHRAGRIFGGRGPALNPVPPATR
jgi:hypothetical protein